MPVVLWFRVGKSAATAILGTPVVVVFFNIPVANPANDVPLIFPTVVAKLPVPVPVTSPVKVIVWSPVLVPLTVVSAETVNVFEVVPPAIVKPVV